MTEIVRLTESSDWIDVGFVERNRTPRSLMEFEIRLHFEFPPYLYIISRSDSFEDFAVEKPFMAGSTKQRLTSPRRSHQTRFHRPNGRKIYGEIFQLKSAVDRIRTKPFVDGIYLRDR